jgi:zinc/manganese transport system substrate-binding protein
VTKRSVLVSVARGRAVLRLALLAAVALGAPLAAWADALRVVATTPDLADLARRVGGDAVEVSALARGPEDVHFVEPRPSFVRALHRADLLIQVGLGLEDGWLPALLQAARNPALQPGGPGSLDASTAIVARDVPSGRLDRAQGDVHPAGNPHYLTDPLNGLRVAAAIRDRLATLRPAQADGFAARYEAFERTLVAHLVGAELAARHAPAVLVAAAESGRLAELSAESGVPLGGWLGALGAGTSRRKAVEDHRAWTYFAERFGIELVAALEPLPGIAPTPRHLGEVIERMRREGVGLILATPYFAPRHAELVADRTGARIVELAHQVGSRPGADDYLATIDHNVRALVEASR